MVPRLAGESVFFAPLFVEPFCFRCFANRAISLIAVATIIRMAFRAFCFSRILSGRTIPEQCVFFGRKNAKMGRIDTGRIFTRMIDNGLTWDVADRSPIRNSVSTAVESTKPESSIAIIVEPSIPNPTSIWFGHIARRKSSTFFLCHAVHAKDYIP